MRDRRRIAAVLASAVLVLAGCGADGAAGDASGNYIPLDGSPRVSDDAGVVTAIDADFATLTLDGETVYEIDDQVQSFASIDGSVLPLRGRLGQYVHVGLDGDTVVWLASIGSVLRVEGRPHTVMYLGSIVDVDEEVRRLTMRDGTVFALSDPRVLDGLPDDLSDPIPATIAVEVASDAVVDVDLAE